METKRILRLTLKKDAFEVMRTGEKTMEFRKPSLWIKSRLFVNGIEQHGLKTYDAVLFTNGYGKSRPAFERKYDGCAVATDDRDYAYSNGLTVRVEKGDIIIRLAM